MTRLLSNELCGLAMTSVNARGWEIMASEAKQSGGTSKDNLAYVIITFGAERWRSRAASPSGHEQSETINKLDSHSRDGIVG